MTTRKRPDPETDARQQNHLASWAWMWAGSLLPVARFIDAVDDGRQPAQADMEHIARALRELFCHRDADASLQAVGKRLAVRRKNGRRELTANESEPMVEGVRRVVEIEGDLVANGASPRAARAEAIRSVASERGVSVRTVQAWHAQYGAHVRRLLRAVEIFHARREHASKPPD